MARIETKEHGHLFQKNKRYAVELFWLEAFREQLNSLMKDKGERFTGLGEDGLTTLGNPGTRRKFALPLLSSSIPNL